MKLEAMVVIGKKAIFIVESLREQWRFELEQRPFSELERQWSNGSSPC